MNLQLPDGKTLTDIPDGTTREQIYDKLRGMGYTAEQLGPKRKPVEVPEAVKPDIGLHSLLPEALQKYVPESVKNSEFSKANAGFLGGLAQSATKLVKGAKDLSTKVNPVSALIDTAFGKDDSDSILSRQEKQGREFVNQAGIPATIGELGGDIAATWIPGSKVGQAVAAIPRVAKAAASTRLLPKIAANVAVGGAGGAATAPILGGDTKDMVVSGLIGGMGGAAAPLVASGLKKAAGLFKSDAVKAEEFLTDLFSSGGRDSKAAAVQLRTGTAPIVAGEQPTISRAASDEFPEFAALQKTFEDTPGYGQLFEKAKSATGKAWKEQLEPMAGAARRGVDPTTGRALMSPAEEARFAQTRPSAAAMEGERVPVPEELRGAMQGVDIAEGVTPPAPTRDALGTTINDAGLFVPQPATAETTAVQRRIQELGDSIEHMKRARQTGTGDSRTLGKDIADATAEQQRLLGFLEQASPNFNQFNTLWRNLSQPQNAGELAQTFQNAAVSRTGLPTASKLLNIMEDTSVQGWQQQMTPAQREQVKTLLKAAQAEEKATRYSTSPKLVRRGPQESTEIAEMIPHGMNSQLSILRDLLRAGSSKSGRGMPAEIAKYASDPEKLAALLEALRNKSALDRLYQGAYNPSIIGGLSAVPNSRLGE